MFRTVLVSKILVNHQTRRGMSEVAKTIESGKTVPAKLNVANTLQMARDYLKTVPVREFAKELGPPTPAQIPKAIGDLVKLFTKSNWREVTVRDAWRNTLVTTEVLCWFFVGEVIGKGTLIGYQV